MVGRDVPENICGETVSEKLITRQVRIAGQSFVLGSRDVLRALRKIEPEPITRHFVVVESRRFPPKQVISALTGLDRADFTTHQARRTLIRLGFPAGRRGREGLTGPLSSAGDRAQTGALLERPADRLRPFAGQWVAVEDGDVLHAAESPHALVAWLAEHGRKAESVFRVPDDELAATGLAPL